MAVNGPLEYVKESLEVSLVEASQSSRLNPWADGGDKSNGSDFSIASTCFNRIVELQNQGFDESDVRAVTSTTYIGEVPHSYKDRATHPDLVMLAATETVRKRAYQSFAGSHSMSSDIDRLEILLPGDGPSPSRGEKGTGRAGQGRRQ